MAIERGFLHYVKNAFGVRWNLLAFGAAAAAGIISGFPSVVLPLVLAGEIVYLAGLSTNSRFKSAVDARENKAKQQSLATTTQARTKQMLDSLSHKDRMGFMKLKNQCVELKRIAAGVKGDLAGSGAESLDIHSPGINRLLWIYLKLLYSKGAIEKFFATIDLKQIQADIDRASARLKELGSTDDDTPNDARRRSSLQDQLKTSQARMGNYENAKDNYEFIQDELARLSSKIASLAEMAINRQDPDFITSEVDTVSASVEASEKAMSELDFLTGWSAADDVEPNLLKEEIEAETELVE